MSVQLILYPQSYNPLSNPVFFEYCVNGIDFTGFDSTATTSVSSSPSYQGAIAHYNSLPLAVNTWGRYDNGSGTPPIIFGSTNHIVYLSSDRGIVQKLSNLTAGAIYNVDVECVTASGSPVMTVYNYNGTTFVGSSVGNMSTGNTTTFQFTAASSDDFFVLHMTSGTNVVIDTISIQQVISQPSGATNLLANGQVICDLYSDEDIPLTLSVDNFKNVAEKTQSYSKDFNLPATKRNNQIFDHIFDITRSDNGLVFNPYIKTQCVLKQDGYILFEGYLRLIDISTDKEKEVSYNVNLYSEVIALADMLKDKTFNNIDFTELQHSYNITQVKNSWNDSGTGITFDNANESGFRTANNTVKYPFVDWEHQTLLSDGTNGTVDFPELVKLSDNFRPFVNCKYLVDRIFQDTQLFSYTSTFFDTADFQKLFMDFNFGEEGAGFKRGSIRAINANDTKVYEESPYTLVEFTGTQDAAGFTASDYYNTSTHTFTAQENCLLELELSFKTLSLTNGMAINSYPIEIEYTINGAAQPLGNILAYPAATGDTFTFVGVSAIQMYAGDTMKIRLITFCDVANDCADLRLDSDSYIQYTITTFDIDFNKSLLNFRGELGQFEFLKGLMTMFNLVSLPDPDNPNNIIIETYESIFNPITAGTSLSDRSIAHDWTDKIDDSEMTMTPLTDLNRETIFKFVEDDDDYTFNVYKKTVNGHLYGSKKTFESQYTLLEGTKEIVAEPFAATVVKPLFGQFTDFITPAIFSANDEATEFEGFENSPRILFNNGIKTLTTCTYYVPAYAGVAAVNAETQFLQFSHLSTIPTSAGSQDFHFGECQLIDPVGQPTVNNLFNLFWQPYYAELYNPDTRIMTIKVDLSPADINTFKLSDKVMIKNRAYRVNRIDYKPNALATVEFILIP